MISHGGTRVATHARIGGPRPAARTDESRAGCRRTGRQPASEWLSLSVRFPLPATRAFIVMPTDGQATRETGMDAGERRLLEELVDALQVVAPLATRLRRSLGEQVEDAVAMEAAADRAVGILRRLQPRQDGR